MRRFLIGLAAVVFLAALLGYMFRAALTIRLMQNVIAQRMSTDQLADLPDGLHVVLCGAGSPLPDPARSGPCVAVIAGDLLYIVDVGSQSGRNLAQLRIPRGQIDGILLTHFHSDHIDGLGELLMQRWVNGAHTEPTPVYGPIGVGQVVEGFNLAYRLDRGYRVDHHGDDTVPASGHGAIARPFPVPANGELVPVIDRDGLTIQAFLVDHSPIEPAVGFRIDYAGRSVVLSGDTVKSANVEKFAQGVDLLVHEALDPELVAVITEGATQAGRSRLAKITVDILDYHATPEQAAEVARDAGVGALLYYHIVPPLLLGPMVDIFLDGVDEVYPGIAVVGTDGTAISLEAGTDSIEVLDLL